MQKFFKKYLQLSPNSTLDYKNGHIVPYCGNELCRPHPIASILSNGETLEVFWQELRSKQGWSLYLLHLTISLKY